MPEIGVRGVANMPVDMLQLTPALQHQPVNHNIAEVITPGKIKCSNYCYTFSLSYLHSDELMQCDCKRSCSLCMLCLRNVSHQRTSELTICT